MGAPTRGVERVRIEEKRVFEGERESERKRKIVREERKRE